MRAITIFPVSWIIFRREKCVRSPRPLCQQCGIVSHSENCSPAGIYRHFGALDNSATNPVLRSTGRQYVLSSYDELA